MGQLPPYLIRHCSHAKNAPARDLASLAGEPSLFAASAAAKLERLQAGLAPLAGRYDAVVANPPYMGSSSLGRWMGSWVKKRYPEAYRDLCTAFIDRGFSLGAANGYSAMVTMQSWMFLGSFEKLRRRILGEHSVSSMAHLGTRAFGAIAGEVVSTAATVFANAKSEVEGAYFRLVDMGSEAEKREGLLQALADPDCGWFYRADARGFEAIPSRPIAYWASKAMREAFDKFAPLSSFAHTRKGMFTGDNDYFLRQWYEVPFSKIGGAYRPYCKGGQYRKWYGNRDYVIRWQNNGEEILRSRHAGNVNLGDYFKPCISWSLITSDDISFRDLNCMDFIMGDAGPACYPSRESHYVTLAALNSSCTKVISKIINPTLNFSSGVVRVFPIALPRDPDKTDFVSRSCVDISRLDWDSRETSWDFKRNPLI